MPAIIDAGLNDIAYTVQAMTSPIAMHGETLAPLMRQAGFRYVFLGIENILEDDLEFLKAPPRTNFAKTAAAPATPPCAPLISCTRTRCTWSAG